MNKNNYSKFKYENSYQLKFSVNPLTKQFSTLNAELRNVKPSQVSDYSGIGVHLNLGQTIIVDNAYSYTQVNYVDQPVALSSPVKRLFFKLFKLS